MTVSCADIYIKQNLILPGGNSLNFLSSAVAMPDVKAAVIGAVGTDSYASMIRSHYREYSIDETRLYNAEGATASNKVYINGQGERFFMPDSWNSGVYGNFRLSDDDWNFAAGFDLWAMCSVDPNFDEALRRKPENVIFCADFLDTADTAKMEQSSKSAGIIFASGDGNLAEEMGKLSAKCGVLCVTTMGSGGSVAFKDGIEYFSKAEPAERVIDTTGCGDAYQAVFAVSYLSGSTIPEAMEKAGKAARSVLSSFGGFHLPE